MCVCVKKTYDDVINLTIMRKQAFFLCVCVTSFLKHTLVKTTKQKHKRGYIKREYDVYVTMMCDCVSLLLLTERAIFTTVK